MDGFDGLGAAPEEADVCVPGVVLMQVGQVVLPEPPETEPPAVPDQPEPPEEEPPAGPDQAEPPETEPPAVPVDPEA